MGIGAGANPLLTSTLPNLELNKLGYIVADENGRTNNLNWKGWGEIALDLDSFSSRSGGFVWSNVTGITIEYVRNPNNQPSERIMFTPYRFYHIQESGSDLVWSKLGPFMSPAGEASLELSANGPLIIDSIVITDAGDMQSLSDLFCSLSSTSKNVNQLSETEFRIQMEASDCSILIFKQAYHPLWQASSTYPLQQIKVNFALNGFIIDKEAGETLHIWYEGDQLLVKGIWISAISLALTAILASTPIIRNRRKRYSHDYNS